jgi:hypothetical protein
VDHTVEDQLSWESAIGIVERELEREFQGSRSHEAIEAAARESVIEFVSEDVRIRAFVPVLAGRTARERLKAGE